jgi:hypothetical protein
MNDNSPETTDPASDAGLGAAPGKALTPAARRALEEAASRRAAEQAAAPTGEEGGPRGPEPTRFGDWERKGLAVDF